MPGSHKQSTGVIDIGRLWIASNLVYATAMWATLLVSSMPLVLTLVGLAGVCWAVATWAPFAIISTELQQQHTMPDDCEGRRDTFQQVADAGMIMGLHNVAITAPQILAALCCSAIFRAFEFYGLEDAVGWILRLASISTLLTVLHTI